MQDATQQLIPLISYADEFNINRGSVSRKASELFGKGTVKTQGGLTKEQCIELSKAFAVGPYADIPEAKSIGNGGLVLVDSSDLATQPLAGFSSLDTGKAFAGLGKANNADEINQLGDIFGQLKTVLENKTTQVLAQQAKENEAIAKAERELAEAQRAFDRAQSATDTANLIKASNAKKLDGILQGFKDLGGVES